MMRLEQSGSVKMAEGEHVVVNAGTEVILQENRGVCSYLIYLKEWGRTYPSQATSLSVLVHHRAKLERQTTLHSHIYTNLRISIIYEMNNHVFSLWGGK